MNATERGTAQRIYPAIRYNDAKRAINWLSSTLGFSEKEVCQGDGDTIAHAELQFAGNLIMLGTTKELGGATGSIYIALDDIDTLNSHYARTKAAGAEIVRELGATDYGSHDFSVRDPEGHIWTFGTYWPNATS